MMPVVGCPKCDKKFKLAAEMVGKTVRCSKCQTAFKAGQEGKVKATGKASSGAKPPKSKRRSGKVRTDDGGPGQASSASLKDLGLSGPIAAQADLFAEPIPNRKSPNPLGNFSIEDPGFDLVDSGEDDDGEDDRDDGVAIDDDKKLLLANPALKSIAASQKKKKKRAQKRKKKPSRSKAIKIWSLAVAGIVVVGILGYVIYTFLF